MPFPRLTRRIDAGPKMISFELENSKPAATVKRPGRAYACLSRMQRDASAHPRSVDVEIDPHQGPGHSRTKQIAERLLETSPRIDLHQFRIRRCNSLAIVPSKKTDNIAKVIHFARLVRRRWMAESKDV